MSIVGVDVVCPNCKKQFIVTITKKKAKEIYKAYKGRIFKH